MSDVSDTSPERHPPPIAPAGTVTARVLARETADLLRQVTDEDRSFAVTHFGRVVAFLVPVEGRALVRRQGRVTYEVPAPEPLQELDAMQISVLRVLARTGRAAVDQLCLACGSLREIAVALAGPESGRLPLAVKRPFGYEITDEGRRHVEGLG